MPPHVLVLVSKVLKCMYIAWNVRNSSYFKSSTQGKDNTHKFNKCSNNVTLTCTTSQYMTEEMQWTETTHNSYAIFSYAGMATSEKQRTHPAIAGEWGIFDYHSSRTVTDSAAIYRPRVWSRSTSKHTPLTCCVKCCLQYLTYCNICMSVVPQKC
jgi:hypothetical protein